MAGGDTDTVLSCKGDKDSPVVEQEESDTLESNGDLDDQAVLDALNAVAIDTCRNVDHFDIKMLNEQLQACIRESDGEVDLEMYILSFQQLHRFFCLLGTVFGFIGTDVKSKLDILQGYRKGDNQKEYETVEKMIEYEKTTDFIHTNKESSGSRTLLRLHRALIFVSQFLEKTTCIDDCDGTTAICREAYNNTLAKYHPWMIRKGATLAMYTLPSKKDLIKRVCHGELQPDEVIPIIKEVIIHTNKVYEQCERAYSESDLLNLP